MSAPAARRVARLRESSYPRRTRIPALAIRAGGTLWCLAAVACMPRLADRLVYFPTRVHDAGTPAAIGLAYEDAAVTASDGVRLHGWFVPAPGPGPAVLFLHGNAGNVSHRLDKLALLHGLGASVLLLDWRGYGASEGAPDEPGLTRDAEAGWAWLRVRTAGGARLVAYGESLGGSLAVHLAAHHAADGLVLEGAPTSILAVAQHHYPWLPVALLLAARYDALGPIAHVRGPILILHARDDAIVPFAMAEALQRAAPAGARLVPLTGGHNDAVALSAAAYRAALAEFFGRLR